ncbi:ABC transporter ATP-binding protein [Aeribacillus composti]|uniref:ABC transporter ATP-binding protein n=1 Tax=Aeribacillus TaxID=1055323 RepID=UPI00102392B1|nr:MULTISPECIES: ABC transporter ATP-binding protein [Aeribacillus]MED0717372.1 ABC transporter ATP-binding protein [Aeribacillus composti]RZI51795.1 ABC transporter ATP-binding protein [Aeribacillus pallidus]TVZ78900.1 ABC-2 type transport system ATP-binding protein [Aeribacillus composti]
MSYLLDVQNITKRYGNKVVLKNVTFNVPSGSIVGFIGDNGAGKSTTFKTILGLVSQDSGRIKIFGKENIHKQPKMKEKIGVVFDAMNLPAHLTIKQLNKVFLRIFNTWNQDDFFRLVNSFSLPEDKQIYKFSRGMSMKLSIAVALSHNAKLLLLDEATGGLDPSSREQVLGELKSFVRESSGGILLSSHIMSDIEKIASHIVFIKNGEILLNERKDKILEKFAIVDIKKERLSLLNRNIVVAKRDYGSCSRILVSNKMELPKDLSSKKISMEELSLLLTNRE